MLWQQPLSERHKSLLSLGLLIPVPSLAAWVGLILYPNTLFGQLFFSAGKLWILVMPLFWLLWVEGERVVLSRVSLAALAIGLLSGLLIALIIYWVYRIAGADLIDPRELRSMAAKFGMHKPAYYLAMAVYWCAINALLEEYVWRWFVLGQCRKLLSTVGAVLVTALGFTLHHVVATQLYFPISVVLIVALSVFSGGVVWSVLALRYQSIWPSYISHVCADVVIFALGYRLLFQT